MTIYLIRHGETDWNLQRRLQGREDIELNETGVKQAHECGRAFQCVPVDCIVTSPLKRALMTASIIAEYVKVAELITEDDLIERDYGKLAGMTPEERDSFRLNKADEGMEPKDALTQRLIVLFNKYRNNKKYKNIIMVSHGSAINAVLKVLSDDEIGSGITLLKNACISRIDCLNEHTDIVYYNIAAEELSSREKRR